MTTKKEILMLASTLGYFRARKDEKRLSIFEEICASLDILEDTDKGFFVTQTLNEEVSRRADAAALKAKRAIEKQEAEASKPLSGGVESADAHVREMPPGRYVVTTAQNNTDVDSDFLAALLTYCGENDATLLIAKMTYNKNGFQTSQEFEDGIYYDTSIVKYLVDGQIRIGGLIDFVAQANVLPTAKNPLSGFAGITPAGVDVIIPASKIALQCTAALKGGKNKVLYSTGTITKRNYITRKAGAVASSEHNIGALFVDTVDVEKAIVRQLEMMPGSIGFYDGLRFYGPVMSVAINGVEALQFGDIHAEKMDESARSRIDKAMRQFKPKNTICHDVMDFSSRNHHNIKDCAFVFAQHVTEQTIAGDIKTVAAVLDYLSSYNTEIHIIESNHDLAINTWLKNTDFKLDPVNALTYLRCMTALYEHINLHGNTDFNMLAWVYENIGNGQAVDSIVFHKTDESLTIAGVEMGVHGHSGLNGSRGSPAQFRTLGVPLNTGHTHTPSIIGACYTAGVTASLEMGYNVGPSSWAHANVVTYANGQRQIVFM